MTREIVTPKLFQHMIGHPNLEGITRQSLRNAIYRIRKENPGVTMNAAAYVYAEKKNISVFRYLSPEDKASLGFVREREKEQKLAEESAARPRKVTAPKLDFETPFENDAYFNAQSYPYVYVLENSLRQLVLTKFSVISKWWDNPKFVSVEIQEYAKRIQLAESKYGWLKERGDHQIYYVGLFELFKIIERNWNTTFKDVFSDLGLLSAWVKECVPIRNQIAHNVRIRPQERDNLKLRTDYVCRLIERWAKSRESESSLP
jgi:HEPN superfamily Swt1-like protein